MRVPIYGSYLHIGVGHTQEECVSQLPRHIQPHVQKELPKDTEWEGYTFDLLDGHFAVLLRSDDKGQVSIRSVFHEVGHVSAWICYYHQVRICPKDHEAYAYLQGWVGARVMKAVEAYYRRRHRTLNKRAKPAII